MDLPDFGLIGPAPGGDDRMTRYADFIVALLDQLAVTARCWRTTP